MKSDGQGQTLVSFQVLGLLLLELLEVLLIQVTNKTQIF